MAARTVTVEFNEREAELIRTAIACKQASIARSINAASDSELKAVFLRQASEFASLRTKFGG